MMKTIVDPGRCDPKAVLVPMDLKTYILILIVFSFFSCSSMPFAKNKTESGSGAVKDKDVTAQEKKGDKAEQVAESAPQPGDIKVVDGAEYIYAGNRRYMLTPYEPEYVWVKKDQYVPRLGENLLADKESEKARKALDNRISKLEEDLKKKGAAPQVAYTAQTALLPSPIAANMPAAMPSSNLPSPKMKRRVIVLPIADETHYKNEHFGELATGMLISKLENTNVIICIDPNTLNLKGQLTNPENMTILNEVHGIQALIKGTLSGMVADSSSVVSSTSMFVYNTETGTILKQLSGRGSAYFSKENRDSNPRDIKIKSIDASMEPVVAGLQNSVLNIEWHARIASIENGKVYINAGRLSGLENGAALEVYSPGVQVMDPNTKIPLGKMKGKYKGELKVSDLFGIDAACAVPTRNGNFSTSDLIYVKKDKLQME
jgi:hypothetical protein